jgi:exosome complex RNA-binding protein Rrp42 (RNase PH superfamily)
MNIDADAFRKLQPALFYDRFQAAGVRPDGRSNTDVRPLAATARPLASVDPATEGAAGSAGSGANVPGVSFSSSSESGSSTDGSALVRLGGTAVMAAVQVRTCPV